MSYLNRASAYAAAVKANPVAAVCTYFDIKVSHWYYRHVDIALPDAAVLIAKRDGVHHVEWALIDGGHLVPCVVTTCDPATFDTPEGWVAQALDASLWYDRSTVAVRPRSEIESPVAVVWRVTGEMVGKARGEVIAACVALGVNKSTASTQFYKWGIAQKAKA